MPTTYELIDGRPTLQFGRRIPHPLDAVWRAIAEPAQLSKWFPTTVTGEIEAGGHLVFTFENHPLPPMQGQVTDFDPPRLLAFTWGEDRLRFELDPTESGDETELRFTVLLDSSDKAARDGAGWETCLNGLEAVLDGADEEAIAGVGDDWRRYYDEYKRRGFPATAPLPSGGPA